MESSRIAERNERDRRFIDVTLTDEGQRLLKEATTIAREIANQVMSSIDEGDILLLQSQRES